jgi:hypothetical protein
MNEVSRSRSIFLTVATEPKNRQRERMTLPEIFGEEVVDEIVWSIFGLRDFLQHDLALTLDFRGIEHRLEKNIGEHVGRHLEVLAEHLGVVAGVLLAGERVEHPADAVESLGDFRGGAPFGALEKQMLDEMGDAILDRLLVARAVLDPYSDCRGDHLRHRLGDNPHAICQDAFLNHAYANCLWIGCPASPLGEKAGFCRCDRRRAL